MARGSKRDHTGEGYPGDRHPHGGRRQLTLPTPPKAPYCGNKADDRTWEHIAQPNVDVALRSGLPCRAGCGWLLSMTDLARSDKTAFALLCRSRIDHERAEHGYVHAPVRVMKARYDWGKAKRQVLTGQGW